MTAKKCTKTRDARAKVLFCSSRVVHDRLKSLTGYFVYTEPSNMFARLSLLKFESTKQPGTTLKGDAFDGKGNKNGRTAISKTTTLHVHHAFLHISLSSLYDYNVKFPYFTISRLNERTQKQRFYFRFLNFNRALTINFVRTGLPSSSVE